MPEKNQKIKKYSWKKITLYLFLSFSFLFLILYFTVKSQKISENQSKAITASRENEILLLPITNKIYREYALNGDYSEFIANLPIGWNIYSEPNRSAPILEPIKDKKYTYIKNSSLLLETKEENTGIIQTFPTGLSSPIFLQANMLVVSGKFQLVAADKNKKEIKSDLTQENNLLPEEILSTDNLLPYWQTLSIALTHPDFTLESIKILATEPNSKAYITNVAIHPFADYSELFRQIDPVRQNEIYLGECKEKNSQEYLQCLEEKTGLPPDRWQEVGKPKLLWNDQEINPHNSLQTASKPNIGLFASSNKPETITYEVSKIYFATDFVDKSNPNNPTFFQNYVKNYINTIGKSDNLRKQLQTENTKIEFFDPTIPSACSMQGYWSNAKVFLPNSFCNGENQLEYLLVRIGGWDAVFQPNNKIIIDTKGKWKEIKYTIKHETFHFFGAPDSDFVEIRGNYLFPEGNSKRNTIWDDFMYSFHPDDDELKPSEYTIGIVNAVETNEQENFWKFQPNNLTIKNAITGETIREGIYVIYLGYRTLAHIHGIIHPSRLIEFGELEGEKIFLKEPKRQFLNYPYDVAGFIKIESKGKAYTGKFDLIDLSVAKFRGEDTLEVNVYPFGEKYTQIIYPKEGEEIYGFDNIIANIESDEELKIQNWRLTAFFDTKEKVLLEDNSPKAGEKIYIPADRLSFLKDFEGEITLKLSTVYEYDMGQLQLSDTKKYILRKPVIQNVRFIGPNIMLIEGKGFGDSDAIVRFREKGIWEGIWKEIKTFSPELRVIQDDYIEIEIGAPPNPYAKYVPEEWRNKTLEVIVIRHDGRATEKYFYQPNKDISQEPREGQKRQEQQEQIIVLEKPPEKFYYDPPEISPETLTHHFKIQCSASEHTQLYLGLETLDELLNHQYIVSFENCNRQNDIEQNFYLENTQAEKILKSSQQGNYYWFACLSLDKNDASEPNQSTDKENQQNIRKLLGAYYDENKIYNCVTDRIILFRRQYDISPTFPSTNSLPHSYLEETFPTSPPILNDSNYFPW